MKPIHSGASTLSQEEIDKYQLQEQEYEFQQAQKALSDQLTSRASAQIGKKGGQCVIFVRKFLGVGRDKVSGLARNNPTNSDTPQVGSIVKTKESYLGHVAVEIAETETQIEVVESNYHWDQRISTRWIDKDNPYIVGYIQ